MRLTHAVATLVVLAAMLASPAAAADTVLAPDPGAGELTALDGMVVWVSASSSGQTLMRHSAAGTAPVAGAPKASVYRSLDLGRDRRGRLVLSYLRCRGNRCSAMRDDLAGHRTGVKGLAPRGCTLTTAPALWGPRAAYGLFCTKGSGRSRRADVRRTGVYVKAATGRARRLRLPAQAVRFGINQVTRVDLRGTRVAAVVADVYEYAFAQTVTGRGLSSAMVAASEGDSDEHVRGLGLGRSGVLWSLVDASHAGDPNLAVVFRLAGSCRESERLANPAGPGQEEGFRAVGLAVDGTALYLSVPGVGVVTHPFAPERACGV